MMMGLSRGHFMIVINMTAAVTVWTKVVAFEAMEIKQTKVTLV